jgi:hypothetical protein
MRKMSALLFAFLLATLISVSIPRSVQASISAYNWIGPTYRGHDDFYGTTVVAYRTGSEATLVVSVSADWFGYPVNVSAVKVGFDWGVNYSSTECSEASPFQIQDGELQVFTVAFTVPGTTVASNLVTHTYTIYVEHVNSTTGPKRIVYTWEVTPWEPFVVYSIDQAEARVLRKELEAWLDAYTAPLYMPSEAKELWIKATVERNMASDAYEYGNFADAKTHYGNALNFTKEALMSEVDKTSSFEDALLNLIDSAESFLSMQGWGFIIIGIGFGIGFLLMGIGVVVYLVRKSGAPSKASKA